MDDHKKWSLKVIFFIFIISITILTINYIIDPLQFYHKALHPASFSKEQRYQLPGLAKNYDYDTIIIGSSMTENFIPSYIKKRLGFNVLKLSISGASAKEQYLIANLAISTGKVRNVIWGVDYFSLRGEPNRVRDEQGAFPYHFYDHNYINDVKYLLNIDTTVDAAKILVRRYVLKNKDVTDIDSLYTWHNQYAFGRDSVLKEWKKLSTDAESISREYEIEYIEKNLQENVLSLIKNNPGINFYIYHPPYSILQHYYYFRVNPVLFYNQLHAKEMLFVQLASYSNVRIYDFQQESSITFNLNNYKDLAHHTKEINDFIIDSIAEDKYIVTKENLPISLELLKKQTENLRLDEL